MSEIQMEEMKQPIGIINYGIRTNIQHQKQRMGSDISTHDTLQIHDLIQVMDSLEDITSRISSNGSSSNLANSSISLSGQNNLNEQETSEIITHLANLEHILAKSPNRENLRSYFVENEGLTLILMLFDEASFENNTVTLYLLKV
eukprot:CAMPEP_0197001664 /NCGR_PEP_ID=MMETSP1380-20130617/6312_1 /TAXON_ID=5936 /ORGANISM="Euplotes crassus, Strain CT5" /LENGTH=144 /DNA_ID=CAMNT_0042419425 /DNA_START=107 /DNA_END=541 /DNA_ORIENTATION=+